MSLAKLRSNFRSKLVKLLSIVFIFQALGAIPSTLVTNSEATVTCGAGTFTLDATKTNSTFYIDTKKAFTASFFQLQVTNNTGSNVDGTYSVSLENFTGGKVTLADFEAASHALQNTLNNGASKNMYWYLKASDKTNTSTTFNAIVRNTSSGEECRKSFTINSVVGTIAASANKVTSVVYSNLPSPDANGGTTFTATVKGQTGTIGAGPTGMRDVNLSPATDAKFDVGKYRLSATTYTCGGVTVSGTLYIENACAGAYTAVFTFQYLTATVSSGTASQSVSPIMEIASGTQMKHTASYSFTIATVGTAPSLQVTTSAATDITSSTSTLNGANNYGTYTNWYFCISTTSPASHFTITGSTCTNAGATTVTATEDAGGSVTASKTGLTTGTTYYFEVVGISGGTAVYGGIKSFKAAAYATTGSASSITDNSATITGSQSGISAANVDDATSFFVYTTSDPGVGHIPQSTNAQTDTIVGTNSGTNTTFTGSMTGLSAGTLYYYEIVVFDINGLSYLGGVRSFLTTGGTFQVLYNGNTNDTGSAPTDANHYGSGATATVKSKNTLGKVGNVFDGWCTVAVDSVTVCSTVGTKYSANDTLTVLSTKTLYAIWLSGTVNYSITYYGNANDSGTPPTDSNAYSSLDTATVLAKPAGFAKNSFAFAGWCTSATTPGDPCPGSDLKYLGGDTLTVTSDVILYALWDPTFSVNYDGNSNTGGNPPTDSSAYLNNASVTVLGDTGNLILSGYSFDGWCTTQPTVGNTCGATKYIAGDVFTITENVTLFAIWKTTPTGGGGGGAPVYVPHPPTITSISAPEVCALNGQLTITGTYLSGATVKVDGVSARVVASSSGELTVNLPDASVGVKTITVTNVDGFATTTVRYAFADTPVYVNFIYPETYKDRAFSYTFTATDAAKYAVSGVMPAGLTLNPLTGEISGTPTQMGEYVFTIIASNICDTAPLLVYMFVDKPFPDAYTCSVAFNVPASNNISDIKLAQLKTCLSRIPDLSPKYIDPVIFLSGGIPSGLTSDQALTHPRYLPIIDLINSMNLDAQIYYGAFNGSTDSVQLNVYWPEPTV